MLYQGHSKILIVEKDSYLVEERNWEKNWGRF
jgi:hypothetical protein